jgi:hypothetical protein
LFDLNSAICIAVAVLAFSLAFHYFSKSSKIGILLLIALPAFDLVSGGSSLSSTLIFVWVVSNFLWLISLSANRSIQLLPLTGFDLFLGYCLFALMVADRPEDELLFLIMRDFIPLTVMIWIVLRSQNVLSKDMWSVMGSVYMASAILKSFDLSSAHSNLTLFLMLCVFILLKSLLLRRAVEMKARI